MARKKSSGQTFPTHFQQKTCWNAITLAAIATIAGILIGAIWLGAQVLSFLQPILVPLAAAGIIAYLLDPVVKKLEERGVSTLRAVILVFFVAMAGIVLIALLLLPAASDIWSKKDSITEGVGTFFQNLPDRLQGLKEKSVLLAKMITSIEEGMKEPSNWAWLQKTPALLGKLGTVITKGLGVFGYLIGFFLVPVYLFFFLRESQMIKRHWVDYVPLKASRFKDEVVSVITEINGYLVAFFRGQLVVSMIDGVLVSIGLALIGLPYAFLIGVFVALLGLIPYLGNLMCLLPAMAISVWHFQGATQQVWVYPLVVIAIFTVTQQLNSLFTAPRIIGEAVGLHPLTVIFSVLFWSMLIGGLLGALLAVPLTASVKVLFRRYIWELRLNQEPAPDATLPADSLAAPNEVS